MPIADVVVGGGLNGASSVWDIVHVLGHHRQVPGGVDYLWRAADGGWTPFCSTSFADGKPWQGENAYGPEQLTISR